MRSSLVAESVTDGHPDKVADRISDAIVDAALTENPFARMAAEVLIAHNRVTIAGEVSGASPNYKRIAMQVLHTTGYTHWRFDQVTVQVHEQSANIAQAVASGGAGDQAIVYGYATNETPSLMPKAVVLAHEITRALRTLGLGPDGKSLVSVTDNGTVDSVFVSVQAPDEVPTLREYIQDLTHCSLVALSYFTVGGPEADTGLTGRKCQVDTYGGACGHGGGAFSGKDPSKIDRTGAYLARYIARHLVLEKVLPWAEVVLAYGFGLSEPLKVIVKSARPGQDDEFVSWVWASFDLSPRGAISLLGLLQPIYFNTAAYGHFGRAEFPWEK